MLKYLYLQLDKVLPLSLLLFFCNIILRLRGIEDKITTENDMLKIVSRRNLDYSIAFLYRSRIPIYLWGIEARLSKLASEYGIEKDTLNGVDTVVDCGANIGEIGLYLKYKYPKINYVAFEPGKKEFGILLKNMGGYGCLHNIALWDTHAELNLYEKGISADSSLLEVANYESKILVSAIPMDSIDIEGNKLFLKIEGEGAEPEILRGAVNTLKFCELISVDCGFERGLDQTSTLFEVYDVLEKYDFKPRIINKNRLTTLYSRD